MSAANYKELQEFALTLETISEWKLRLEWNCK